MSYNGSPFGFGLDNDSPHHWPPVQIAGYQIEQEIGRGGMAVVYRAIQQSLGRQVAIKILLNRFEEDNDFAQRFKREGCILAQLLHPNIIVIYDIGISENGRLFLSMEYLSGGTLNEKIKQGLSFKSTIQIIRSIANALGYAHEQGIIHRDVKPSNIMFRHDGIPVLTDFGVARMIESKTIHTMSGMTIGSPGYMSPEQATGENATIQSDLYSLGVVLYEMLTGCQPYQASNPIAIVLKHLYEPIPKLPNQHAHLQPVLNKLLAKKISDRYKNTSEFLQALNSILDGDTRAYPKIKMDINYVIKKFPVKKIHDFFIKKSRLLILSLMASFAAVLMVLFYILNSWNSADRVDISKSDKQHHQEITALLKLADMQLKAGLVTIESGENSAEATYRRILPLDQNNIQMRAGLNIIAKEYGKRARQSLDKEALQESLNQIERGLAIAPQDMELSDLYREINSKITEIKARKAQKEEQQQSRLQADLYLTQAQNSLKERRLEISLAHIEQGLLAVPNHPALLALRKQIQDEYEKDRQKTEELEQQRIEYARQQEEVARLQKVEKYFTQALRYQRSGKYLASLQQIQNGLALIPNHQELLYLREKVRLAWSAEQQRQQRRAVKVAKHQTKATVQINGQSDPNLNEIMDIKNAVDALDKSLGR